jgi:hypothetical protein
VGGESSSPVLFSALDGTCDAIRDPGVDGKWQFKKEFHF